jgi:hypothetical protein
MPCGHEEATGHPTFFLLTGKTLFAKPEVKGADFVLGTLHVGDKVSPPTQSEHFIVELLNSEADAIDPGGMQYRKLLTIDAFFGEHSNVISSALSHWKTDRNCLRRIAIVSEE